MNVVPLSNAVSLSTRNYINPKTGTIYVPSLHPELLYQKVVPSIRTTKRGR